MKKPLSILLALLLVLSAALPAGAAGAPGFTDVPAGAWYAGAVNYAVEKGLMNGIGNSRFDPSGKTTRAQVATVLYNMEGQPAVAGSPNFSDVRSGWYYAPVQWASNEGIVNGKGDGRFAPNENISRQDLAVMLYGYAKYKGYDQTAAGSLGIFSDGAGVANYARTPMQWAVGKGIINGSGNSLLPKDSATRAQMATMLKSFCENVAEDAPPVNPTPPPVDPTPPVQTPTPVPTAEPTAEPTVEPTPVPPAGPKVPVVGYEYGPMKATNYYSTGKYWWTNDISSLVFTKVEDTSAGYKLSMSMQGVTDDSSASINVYFYDANDRVLENVRFTAHVSPNTPYNVLAYRYVDKDVVDNAERIAFFSYTGEPVEGGNTQPPEPTAEPTSGPTTSPTTEPTSEPTASPTTDPTPTPGLSRPMQLASYIQANGQVDKDGERYISYQQSSSDVVCTGRITYQPTKNRLMFMNLGITEDGNSSVAMYYDLATGYVSNPVLFIFDSSIAQVGMAANINPATYTTSSTLSFTKIQGPALNASTLASVQKLANTTTRLSILLWQKKLVSMGYSLSDFGFNRI